MNTKRSMGSRLTLTTLPDIAIDEILIRLPIKDAVRTSVLSRGWRRRWHSIPALDLWADLPASQILPTDVISQILLQHSGTIRVFRAKLDAGCPIYCWLSTLLRRAASTLRSLTLHYDGVVYINSVGRYFPNLTHLHLSCDLAISPDRFSGIPSLRTLHLEHFCTKPSVLISKFPLLETLIVKDIDLMTDGANENIVQESGIDIVAPNLRRLELLNVDHDHFTIIAAPLLETLIISLCNDVDGFHGNSSLMEVVAAAPRIKRLEVDHWLLGVWARDLKDAFGGKIPMRIPIVMEHLRVMSLEVLFDRKKQIALAVCLLRSTPNLQELEIRGCSYHADEHLWGKFGFEKDFWEAQEDAHVFERLGRVKMTNIEGIKSELYFIRFVLAKAQALKTMMVTFCPYIKTMEWLFTKLLGFPRASNQARILLTDEAEADELEEWG